MPLPLFAQMGKDGARTITTANTIVNEYTLLSSNTVVGSTVIAVNNSGLNTFNRFTATLSAGDLIMIIQIQGATITATDDSTFGNISSYNNCGNYELRQVASVPSATSISLSCGLTNAYTASAKTLVIRVPRYSSLVLNAGGSVTCPPWDGTQGGVVAIESQNGVVINSGAGISASGKGFRGGALLENLSAYGVLNWRFTQGDYGGEKGESIAGFQADYDALGGRYCKGAPANGGGGANAHNSGGGGGGNASALPWTGGRGTPDPTAAYVPAWNMEYTGFASSVSGGGGRGGYSFSSSNQNELTLPPGNTTWGGDYRRINGGLGGRTLNYSSGRIFLGGGGGSGDQNDNKGGVGGAGGGIVYITTRGTVSGVGTVSSDGNAGANSATPPLFNTSADGAGGGGAGGTILIESSGAISGININANGGVGGNQVVAAGNSDAYGPGGGGGGGYVAITNGAIARTANGGNNGTSNSGSVSSFPPNGATRGGIGQPNEVLPTYSFSINGDTICQGSSAQLTANVTGSLPTGAVINWYNSEFAQNPIGSGVTYNTPALSTTTTYYVGVCPGYYRIPVTVEVGFITGSFTPPTVCTGSNAFFSGQAVSSLGPIVSWTWNYGDGSSFGSGQIVSHSYANPGSYLVALTIVDSYGCQAVSPGTVNVQAGPLINYSLSNTNGCSPLTVGFNNSTVGANGYVWSFGDGSTSTATNPSHIYNSPGTYSVYLVASNGLCADTLFTNNIVAVSSRPTASFSAIATLCQGDTSVFVNLSSGNGSTISSYAWDFGDGSPTSNLVSPRHFYTTPGIYQVRLTTSTGSCTDDTLIAITVIPSPVAAFNSSSLTGCTPSTINFNNTTTGGAAYVWTFGDGGTSTSASPSHVYTTAGTYTVTLIANQGACRDTARSINLIRIFPSPRSSFSVADSVCQGVILPFSNTSTGNGSPITSYSWNFGDGTPLSNQISPVHLFTLPGLYQVQLTVTTANCTDDTVFAVYVGPTPVVSFTPSNVQSCGPLTVSFSNSTTGLPTSYTWNFGDGSPASSAVNPTHFYGTNGTYSVTLIAVKDFCRDTGSATVTISPQPISSFSTANVCLGDSVRFNNLSSISGGIIGSYVWDFGDGSPLSNTGSPAHFYTAPGTYQVRLTAIAGPCTDDTLLAVTVSPAPIAGFSSGPSSICTGSAITFTNTTTGSPFFSWNFGDGSPLSSVLNPTHVYTSPGNFTVTLIASQGSCADTLIRTNVVTVTAGPFSSFSAPAVCSGDSVLFTNLSTGSGFSSSWDFGDGSSSTSNSPAHLYSSPGSYQVRLIVASGICTDDTVITVVVGPAPQAQFTSNVTTGCEPLVVSFSNTSAGNPSYTWNFDDGNLSSAVSPTHNFYVPGPYYVTLIATQGSCSDTFQTYIEVYPSPVASFSTVSSACPGDTVQFTMNGTVGLPAWNFGDATPLSFIQSPAHVYSSSGSYQVSLVLTNSYGCADTALASIQVSALPVVNFSASNLSGCDTLTVAFNPAVSGATSYSWLFGDGGTSSLSAPSHTYTLPGVYTVTLTAISSAGCSTTRSRSSYIIVRPSPIPQFSTTDRTICRDACIAFSGISTGTPTSWLWNLQGGLPSSSFGQNVLSVCYPQVGSYDVSLTVSDGYCTRTRFASDYLNVVDCSTLPTAAFISSDTFICDNACIDFVSLSLNATLWNWRFPGGTPGISSLENPTNICYGTPGTYPVTLIATNPLGADSVVISNLIQVNSTPAIPSFSQVGDTLIATAGYAAYQWFYNNIPISGATGQRYTALLSGSYAVEVFNAAGCSVVSPLQQVSLVGIEEAVYIFQIALYPNPTSGNSFLVFQSTRKSTGTLKVMNAIGQIVFSETLLVNPGFNQFSLPMEQLAAGAYWIEIDLLGRITRKLIKY
ncbi:MAG: PKD domain-containing protein [Bacteroidota bacterium]